MQSREEEENITIHNTNIRRGGQYNKNIIQIGEEEENITIQNADIRGGKYKNTQYKYKKRRTI
jgi:pectate lyase